jgi:hypothetical protein
MDKEVRIMLTHKLTLAVCAGMLGTALLASESSALTVEECSHLSGNQYLAAIERGACSVDFETAAGPQQDANAGGDDSGDGDTGGRGDRTGKGDGGGGDRGGGGGGDGGDGGGSSGGGGGRAGTAPGRP